MAHTTMNILNTAELFHGEDPKKEITFRYNHWCFGRNQIRRLSLVSPKTPMIRSSDIGELIQSQRHFTFEFRPTTPTFFSVQMSLLSGLHRHFYPIAHKYFPMFIKIKTLWHLLHESQEKVPPPPTSAPLVEKSNPLTDFSIKKKKTECCPKLETN